MSAQDNRYTFIKTVPSVLKDGGLKEEIKKGLLATPKSLPYFLLYDDKGSDIFEEICTLEEYYPTRCEREILDTYINEIVTADPPFTLLVELGSGSSSKTRTLIKGMLDRLRASGDSCSMTYAPIDISGAMLGSSCENLLKEMKDPRLNVLAINGFYKDGLEAVRRMFPNDRKMVIWLGSSIGNLEEDEALPFLRDIRKVLSSEDRLLLGMDLMKDTSILHAAYDDAKGVTANFTLNIWNHLNQELGGNYFDLKYFKHRAFVNTEDSRVEISLECIQEHSVEVPQFGRTIRFAKGELVRIEHCYKYTFKSINAFGDQSGFSCAGRWMDKNKMFSVNIFAPKPAVEVADGLQSVSATELQKILEYGWKCSDTIFSLLPSPADFYVQPITLRNPFIFYVGHVAAFSHSHVLTHTLGHASFNAAYEYLFSRGIDPSVDDPSSCHAHPEIPTSWPSVDEVEAYKSNVRQHVKAALSLLAQKRSSERTARLCAEHELMHSETLLYMIMQMDTPKLSHEKAGALPPSDLVFGTDTVKYSTTVLDRMIIVPPGKASLGADFDTIPFGWDNEFPASKVDVSGFEIGEYPITNGQFMKFVSSGNYENPKFWGGDWKWKQSMNMEYPILWRKNEVGNFSLKTLWGDVPMANVLDWPVNVSWAEANAYANWRGSRLPTEAEFNRAAYAKDTKYPWGNADPIPGVHGNFGFHRWCPGPVDAYPAGASGYGVKDLVSNGWEWTSTKFAPFNGFIPHIPHYPGYSSDFFDDNHYVMLGASWATTGSLIRKSFRNWFQPHYPYMFSKFRLCRDTNAKAEA